MDSPMPPFPMTARRSLALAAALAALAAAVPAQGQAPMDSVSATVGSGITLASGQATALTSRTPLFVDAAYRRWSSENPDLVWGASARVEVEGRTSLALVPRIELGTDLGPLTVRSGVAAPLVFAPFTLIGVEGSVTTRLALTPALGLTVSLLADAFFLGSDLPSGSVLVMFNGAVGVDLAL